jgi:Killer toxin-resistance protein 1
MHHLPTFTLLTLLLKASGALVLSSPSNTDTTLLPSSTTPCPSTTLTPTQIHDLIKPRQGLAITAPAATLPANPLQMSPITIYQMYSYPPAGGAPLMIDIPYTQTFPDVPEQWPTAVPGVIGMGTIKGEIGVVKTKRFVPVVLEEGRTGMVEVEVKTASSFTA